MARVMDQLRVLTCIAGIGIEPIQFRLGYRKIIRTKRALSALFLPLQILEFAPMCGTAALVVSEPNEYPAPEMVEQFEIITAKRCQSFTNMLQQLIGPLRLLRGKSVGHHS